MSRIKNEFLIDENRVALSSRKSAITPKHDSEKQECMLQLLPEINQCTLRASLCSIHWRTWRTTSPEPTFNPLLTVFFHLPMLRSVPIINTKFTLVGPLLHSGLQCQQQKSKVRFRDNHYKQAIFSGATVKNTPPWIRLNVYKVLHKFLINSYFQRQKQSIMLEWLFHHKL